MMFWLLLFLLLLAVLAVFLVAPGRPRPRVRGPFLRCQFAHRGLFTKDQSVPENSLPAFEAAAKAGVEATKDMVPVFGKAAVHAAACAGVPDQGAIAGYYKILGLSHYIKK